MWPEGAIALMKYCLQCLSNPEGAVETRDNMLGVKSEPVGPGCPLQTNQKISTSVYLNIDVSCKILFWKKALPTNKSVKPNDLDSLERTLMQSCKTESLKEDCGTRMSVFQSWLYQLLTVTVRKWLNILEPQFPHLQNGNNNSNYARELYEAVWGLS